MPKCVGIDASFYFADATPENIRGVSILFIACHDAAFAPNALGHVEVEAILFPRAGRRWQLQIGPHTAQRSHQPLASFHRCGQTKGRIAFLCPFE
jgi:hypothetical protein